MSSVRGDKGRDFEPGAVPRRTAREARGLPIGALEAFVLGQVDGKLSLEEVAAAAGLTVPDAVRIMVRLSEVGAIELSGRSRRKPSRSSMRRSSKNTVPKGAGPTRSLTASVIPARARDLTGLATTAEEAFVVGQIDGLSSAGEIASLVGLPFDHVAGILAQLARAGAVVLEDTKKNPSRKAAPESKRAARPASPTNIRRRSSAHQAAARAVRSKPPTSSSKGSIKPKEAGSKPSLKPKAITPLSRSAPPRPPSPRDDAEICELRPEVQKQVTELYARLRTDSHYELLGVTRGADKMTVKRAFYALVAILHPDRHFNKKLGPFKTKINDVFLAITAAHDVLSNPEKRASYDATLRASVPVRPPPPAPVPSPEPASTPLVAPPWSGPRDKTLQTDVREAFAARLGGAQRPSSVPPPPAGVVGPDGGASLKRFFDEKMGQAGRQKARVFVVAAEDALARGDAVAAAQHYRLALQLNDTPEVRAALEAAEVRGGDKMFDVHVRQGRSDERGGRWAEAARHYERAYKLRGEAWLAERRANALRRSGADLRQAVKLAEEAVAREPQNAAFRATLAEVCFDAGLLLRARAEAQRALAMAPGEERGKAVMAQVARAAKAR